MQSKEIVLVETTDPASKEDLREFCHKSGNILLEQSEENGIIKTLIKRK